MRKLFSVLLLVIAMPLVALAQDGMGSVLVTLKDGSKLSIPRSGVAKITFDSIQLSALEEVDLGLSVKWANVNIDVTQPSKVVSSPEECGGYYGWADPTGLKTSDNKNDYPGMTRPKKISGTQYDIATQQLGDEWRLPTAAEFEELLTLKHEQVTVNDMPGIQFTAENGNSIFLPLAGYRYKENVFQTGMYGYYWSGDLNSVLDWMAVELNLGEGFNRTSNNAVYNGCSVRAVKATAK